MQRQPATSMATGSTSGDTIGKGAYMALAAALLGWMFDGAEMGVFSMVGQQALKDLMSDSTDADRSLWFGVITAGFLVGAATGGVVFGWLGDRIGRVRAMTLSVLVYALFTGLGGFAGSALQLGLLRFIAALGMGGEWSLGVALVMEVWPNRSRAFMAGLIGAAANVGYLLVGVVGIGLSSILLSLGSWLPSLGFSSETTAMLLKNDGWRIMMMLGTTPALLTFFIRIFVPESERWLHEKESGKVNNWANRDLIGVLIGAAGPMLIVYLWTAPHNTTLRILGTVAGLAIALVGYTYPVIQYLKRLTSQDHARSGASPHGWKPVLGRMLLGAGLSGVALLGTWGAAQWAPKWSKGLATGDDLIFCAQYTQICSAAGAIVGTILAALAGDWLGRRVTYTLMCITAFISVLAFYLGNTEYGTSFLVGAFFVGVFSASFYGWLPLYLPELFTTNVRATGQGFSFNFGRIIAAVGALQVGNLFLFKYEYGGRVYEKEPLACSVMALIYIVGVVLIWFAPETKGKPLPE